MGALRPGPRVSAAESKERAVPGRNREGSSLGAAEETGRPARIGSAGEDQRLAVRLRDGADEALETGPRIEDGDVSKRVVTREDRKQTAGAEGVCMELDHPPRRVRGVEERELQGLAGDFQPVADGELAFAARGSRALGWATPRDRRECATCARAADERSKPQGKREGDPGRVHPQLPKLFARCALREPPKKCPRHR